MSSILQTRITGRDFLVGFCFLLFAAAFAYLYIRVVQDQQKLQAMGASSLTVFHQQTRTIRRDFVRPKAAQTSTDDPIHFVTMETTNVPVAIETFAIIGTRNPMRGLLKVTQVKALPTPGDGWMDREFMFFQDGSRVEVLEQ